MTTFSLQNSEDVRTFVQGCTFYGTGGGGNPEYGRNILNEVTKEGKVIRITDVSEISDDVWTCSAFGMGSIAPRSQGVIDEMKAMDLTSPVVHYKLSEAIRELENYSNTKVSVIVPVEIGGANAPDPVATANRMGLTVVDGDYTGGRASPESVQTMAHLEGNRMQPLVSVDEWGDTVIIKKTINNKVAEKIGKLVSVLAFGDLAGNATWLFRGSDMKRLITPGTLSRSFHTGKMIDALREERTELREFAKSINAYHIFKGRVSSKEEENRDAEYYWGSYVLEGQEEFKGHTFKIWFKNENQMSWLDGRTYAMSPDLITALNTKTCEPTVNPRIGKGDALAIFAIKALDSFRTKKALDFFGPSHFGFDVNYVPLETIVK